MRYRLQILALAAVFMPSIAWPADDETSRTVIGPRNPDLAAGAQELLAGNAEEGVRLTERGLGFARDRNERLTAYSNLCAGYIMLEQLQRALDNCNLAIELNEEHWRSFNNRAIVYIRLGRYEEAERDIARGQELNPESRKLKIVKSMLLDETDPVAPSVIIDDRRRPADAGDEE